MDNNYSISIYHDKENSEFIATCKEFPHLSGIADDKTEALEILNTCIDIAIEELEENGKPVPGPIEIQSYSGNLRLRIPSSLHMELADEADKEGTSLNQYLVYLLSRRHQVKIQPQISLSESVVFDDDIDRYKFLAIEEN